MSDVSFFPRPWLHQVKELRRQHGAPEDGDKSPKGQRRLVVLKMNFCGTILTTASLSHRKQLKNKEGSLKIRFGI